MVTGANHGIGAAIAEALAAQGTRVVLTYDRAATTYSPRELEQALAAGVGGDALYRARQQRAGGPVLERIRARGGTAESMEADLRDPDSVPRRFEQCEAALGGVDILVNNHTHCVLETFDPALVSPTSAGARRLTAQEADAHFAINARAPALLMAGYLDRYLARGATQGRIINISTDAAHAHTANVSYSASKHALESYSRSAAAELGRYGITVNIVAPGPIQTGYLPPEAERRIAEGTPLGRVGTPEDVADVVVFLASEQARWVTGQLLYVGGGWRMPQ